ncbi:ChbG/HpnK family deacetylase [Legionella fallonii]|uniref:Cellobiose phosphorylase n=1 Tax=Legionella fallonii LLAP-10 TaxID=1212491 RepID=A0A098G861_9GAMM|nr:ChbG/HpnK family deacetylase [Legionella fallonii]CEG58673.1 conserved protein of unknown function [Legionella fallonii LLAP-10]
MSNYKTIVLCADDFGINPGVSVGILKLADRQRLSAVSCMANMPDFNLHAHDLCAVKDKVQTGLHFNLTEGFLLAEPHQRCFSLNALLMKSHLRWVNPLSIANEFNTQLDHYISMMGGLPDFIDGHQHMHQFPGIRQVILKIYKQRLQAHGTFIRSTFPSISLPPYRFKAQILAVTGGRALSSALKKSNISHNDCFSGIYDFNPGSNYRDLFRQWMSLIPTNTLIMCHPGEGMDNADAIAAARRIEMDYFLSDAFLEDCQEYRVKLRAINKG